MNAVLRKFHEEARERKLRMFPQCRPAAVVIPLRAVVEWQIDPPPPTMKIIEDEPLPIQRNAHVLAFRRIRARIPVPAVLTAVATVTGVEKELILSRYQGHTAVKARHLVMYVLHKHTCRSLCDIGRRLDRDHATVLTSIRAFGEKIASDTSLAKQVAAVLHGLGIMSTDVTAP